MRAIKERTEINEINNKTLLNMIINNRCLLSNFVMYSDSTRNDTPMAISIEIAEEKGINAAPNIQNLLAILFIFVLYSRRST